MKILFLANRVPYPPFRGDKLKIFNLARRLAAHHELHLITFAQNDEDLTWRNELEHIFKKVVLIKLPKSSSVVAALGAAFGSMPFQAAYFKSGKMHQALRELLAQENYDVVHVQHLRMAQYMLPHPKVPAILDLPDAFSLYWQRKVNAAKSPLHKLLAKIEQKRVAAYEQVLQKFALTLACSREDVDYLSSRQAGAKIELLPNGVDTDIFFPKQHDYAHGRTILFTGNMDYGPNVDAVIYFAREIFPIVLKAVPDAQFVIAGQRPLPKVQALSTNNISVTGFIPELSEMYNSASLVVAPLRFGAGTQNKVLEAMAMGIPVVCTNIGFAGLGIESGAGAIMQTDPQKFAEAVIELMQSQSLRENVGRKGISVIQTKFSWDIVAKLLEEKLIRVAGKS